MSTKLMTACWDLEMPLPKKIVLISLADQANDDGHCSPSLDAMERRCCLSRAGVFKTVAWLERQGYLRRSGAEKRKKTYLLTPALGRPEIAEKVPDRLPENGESVVHTVDYGSPHGGLRKSTPETTVVHAVDYQPQKVSPPITPPLKDKEEERGLSRARDPVPELPAEFPVSPDFRPPAWVADRLATHGLPRDHQPAHLLKFISWHRGKGTLRSADGWGEQFVTWMVDEHQRFSQAKKENGRAHKSLTPEERLAQERRSAVSNAVSELRTARKLSVAPNLEPSATAALMAIGDWSHLRDAPDFEQRLAEFASRYEQELNSRRAA